MGQRIEFENKNFMHANWKDADVVFVSATAFNDELMASISKKCELLKPGARVITLTRQLVQSDAQAFREINRQHCHCSFGPATAFVYLRVDPSRWRSSGSRGGRSPEQSSSSPL